MKRHLGIVLYIVAILITAFGFYTMWSGWVWQGVRGLLAYLTFALPLFGLTAFLTLVGHSLRRTS